MTASQPVHGQRAVPAGFEDTLVASVASPTSLAFTPDGRLLIASQWGQIYLYENGNLLGTPALDLGAVVCNFRERGMLGLAVDVDFAVNQFIYVTYIFNKFGNCEAEVNSTPVGRVSRFRMNGNTVDPASEQVLIDDVPSPSGVHNLDDVEFGKDGYLYITVGDGGCDYAGDSGCFNTNDAARDLNALVGKILRVTRDGEIPPDNPYSGPGTVRCNTSGRVAPGLVCQEIFATGLRNPWRIAFDPNATGARFFINDVGQDTWEEINDGLAGADYGWNLREGFCVRDSTTDCSPVPPAGLTNPLFSYGRADGCSSVTGGAFVPNGVWPSDFNGLYLFSDFVCGSIFKLIQSEDGSYVRQPFVDGLGEFSAVDLLFGPHDGGTALYYATYGNGGEVRRIAHVGAANQHPVASISANPLFGPPPLVVNFDGSASSDPDGDALTYAWDFGDGSTGATAAAAQHTYQVAGTYMTTLRVTDPAGASSTATVRIDVGNTPPDPVILSPAADYRFAVGETILLRGQASDAEDGNLPASSLTWRVLLHHNTHTHPFLFTPGANDITFQAPGPENLEAAAVSYLDVLLTATDSKGSTRTITQPLMPRFAQIDFLSDPPGATLRIDDGLVTTPASFMSWVNYGVTVEAPSQVGSDGALVFALWSDGGPASHTIRTPEIQTSYTAQFALSPLSADNAFNGTPASLPGTIEAENFDRRPDNLAYSDTTPSNAGGQYRLTAVDIESTSDTGNGYNLGWVFAGEWLNYTVDVSAGGTYAIELRVASSGPGGTFHIEVDGVDKTGPLSVPNTGGWQNWQTIRRTGVSLNAGLQLWRLVMDSNGSTTAVGNFNFIRVGAPSGGGGSTPFGGTPSPLPGVLQAENFDDGGSGVAYVDTTPGNAGGQHRVTDVDVELAEGVAGQYNVGWIFAGEWLNYTVNVGSAGTYDLEARVASAGSGGTFHIEVEGVDKTGPLTVPDTGGWQAWTIIRASGVSLNAGRQFLRIVMDTNGATTAVGNLDWIRAVASTTASGLLRGPYLQQVNDSSSIVVWTTRDFGAPEVQYRGPDGMTIVTSPETRFFPATQTGLDLDFYQHEAHLAGLTSGTRYSYDVFDGFVELTSGQEAFTTAPAAGSGSVRFIAFGDSGVGSNAQRQLATRMSTETFDLALHTGDIAYGTPDSAGGGSYRQYDDWLFGIYAPWLRSHPFFPSIGNHDDEVEFARAYRDVFVLPPHGATAAYPDNAERYYSFDYGPVHFIALDTERALLDPARQDAQRAWLEADLSATNQPWRIVFFHRPPYNAGMHHASQLDVRQAFSSIFERYHVQLVLTGHEHDYERSVPWRESAPPAGAVTYVVTGGGGAALYPSGIDRWTAASASAHHYLRAAVSNCVIQLEAVGLDGAVFDRYSLDRCAQSSDATPPQVAVIAPSNGSTVSGTIDVDVSATDDVRVEKVDIHVDGALRAVDNAAPYRWTFDTRTLGDGMHTIEAQAYDIAGRTARSSTVSFNIANGTTTAREVVLYASDVSVIKGNWTRVASTTGAGGLEMSSDDRTAAATAAPSATPPDFFEASFITPAGAYRIWLRLRGAAESKFNESVWVQLSDATDGAGAPLWRIGTDRGLLVNLEDCGGCGVSGWGWQDNAWWLDESSVVRFTTDGSHTIRVQTREDGVKIDQIVLSPAAFFTSAPGLARNDHTIVPK